MCARASGLMRVEIQIEIKGDRIQSQIVMLTINLKYHASRVDNSITGTRRGCSFRLSESA